MKTIITLTVILISITTLWAQPALNLYTPSSTDVCEGTAVIFTNNYTEFSSYDWDFGNGQTSTDTNPAAVSYTASATPYTTSLTINDFAYLYEVVVKVIPWSPSWSDSQPDVNIKVFDMSGNIVFTMSAGSTNDNLPKTIPVNITTPDAQYVVKVYEYDAIGGNSLLDTVVIDILNGTNTAINGGLDIDYTCYVGPISDSEDITVNATPTVTLNSFSDVCENDASFVLSGGSPVGGTYSGTGVSGGNFDPAAAGAGTHTITYSYTDINGCSGSASQDITVNAVSTVSLSPFSEYYINDDAFTLSGGNPAGGTYSGPGVSGGNFDPSVSGAGIHTITYTYTNANGCTGTATQNITVRDINFPLFSLLSNAYCSGPVDFTNLAPGFANYTWDFGNGQSSTTENPAPVDYPENPTPYLASLTIADFAYLDNIIIKSIPSGWADGVDSKPDLYITIEDQNGNEVYTMPGSSTDDDLPKTIPVEIGLPDNTYYVKIFDYDAIGNDELTGTATITMSDGKGNFVSGDLDVDYNVQVASYTYSETILMDSATVSATLPDPTLSENHYAQFLDANSVVIELQATPYYSTGPFKYYWIQDGRTVAYTNYDEYHPSSNTGVYQVIVEDSLTGCKKSAEYVYNFYYKKGFSVIQGNCNDLSVEVRNLYPGQTSYNWDFGDGQTSTAEEPGTVTYSSPGEYTITLTSDPGVKVLKEITITAIPDSWNDDLGTTPDLYVLIKDQNGNKLLSTKSSFADNGVPTTIPLNMYLTDQNYTIEVKETDFMNPDDDLGDAVIQGNGTSGTATDGDLVFDYVIEQPTVYTQTVKVELNPVVDLGSDITINSGETATLDAGAGFSSYAWNTGATSQSITVSASGSYKVSAMTANGCVAEDSVFIDVLSGTVEVIKATEGFELKVYPNPNNGTFTIESSDNIPADVRMQVFDMIGAEVYSTTLKSGQIRKSLNLDYLSDGIYFIRMQVKDQLIIKRIVIQ